MDDMDYRRKTDEVIAKFKNGEELFRRSAMFNRAVRMMVEGANEYEVLEQIIVSAEQTHRSFEEYVRRCSPNPITFVGRDYVEPREDRNKI